jgi:hypothetical protein
MSKWKDRFFYVFSVVVFAFGIFFLHRLQEIYDVTRIDLDNELDCDVRCSGEYTFDCDVRCSGEYTFEQFDRHQKCYCGLKLIKIYK